MSTYQEKVAKINTDITANGIRKITGPVLNAVLKFMLDANIATIDLLFNGVQLVGNVYTKVQTDVLLKAIRDRLDALEAASGGQNQFLESELSTTLNMISGGTVRFTPTEILNKNLEYSLYYNGVFIPKSVYAIDNNNLLTINLSLLNLEPKVGDYIVLKYYKQ